jgi:tripartite-type tricarboxylate transporter receptor subunit TctC
MSPSGSLPVGSDRTGDKWRGNRDQKPLILLALASAAIGIADARPALAQTYPARPINIIVPFPPGNTDIMARALQVEISKSLRQTIIINNKGGASGTLGIRDLVKAEPDGYTLALIPNNPLTAQPHLQKLPYGVDSFRYVCNRVSASAAETPRTKVEK